MQRILDKNVPDKLEEILNPDICAVLAIDIQNDAMSPAGKLAEVGHDVTPMVELLPRCAEFIQGARLLSVPLVHIRIAYLPDGWTESPAWLRTKLKMTNTLECFVEGTWGAEICEECAPLPGEPIVTKHRSSGFVGTNLDLILRSKGVQTVVVIGESTNGCVEATFRDAAHLDYFNVLVEDCVAAFDPDLHEASVKCQRARHDVCTAEQVLSVWQRARARSTVAQKTNEESRTVSL